MLFLYQTIEDFFRRKRIVPTTQPSPIYIKLSLVYLQDVKFSQIREILKLNVAAATTALDQVRTLVSTRAILKCFTHFRSPLFVHRALRRRTKFTVRQMKFFPTLSNSAAKMMTREDCDISERSPKHLGEKS